MHFPSSLRRESLPRCAVAPSLAATLAAGLLLAGCSRQEGPTTPPASPDARPLVIGVSLLNLSSEFIVMIVRKQAYEKQVLIPFRLVTRENVGEFLK